MSPWEVVSLYLSPLLRPADQSTELDLVKIAVRRREDGERGGDVKIK